MKTLASIAWLALLAAAGARSQQAPAGEFGPNPELPPPDQKWIPTLNVAKAKGWSANATPLAGSGMQVSALARGLKHPRWLYVLPNGDVLVAECEGPARPDDS
jgi:glucose/arabinose dehydrogenase